MTYQRQWDGLRVGVIGLGHWGPNLLRNYADLGVLAAYCDQDPQRLARMSAAYLEHLRDSIPGFTGSWRDECEQWLLQAHR